MEKSALSTTMLPSPSVLTTRPQTASAALCSTCTNRRRRKTTTVGTWGTGWRWVLLLLLVVTQTVTTLPARNDQYDYDPLEREDCNSMDGVGILHSHSFHRQRKVALGGSVRLKCRPKDVSGAPERFLVAWFLNDLPLDLLKNNRLELKEARKRGWPRLRVGPVHIEDEGLYACHWLNRKSNDSGWVNYTLVVREDGPRHTLPQDLHADDKILVADHNDLISSQAPVFTKKLIPILIKPAGNIAELRCHARGPNLTTYWLKDGGKPMRQMGEVKIKGALLKMENLVTSDSGNYTCEVSNAYGSINHTYRLQVIQHVASRPIITKQLVNMTQAKGTTVHFEVGIYTKNRPMPYIIWERDLPHTWEKDKSGNLKMVIQNEDIDTAVKQSLSQEGGTLISAEDPQVLVLTNVTEDDSGWYTCIVTNSLGSSLSTAYLNVTDGIAAQGWLQFLEAAFSVIQQYHTYNLLLPVAN